MSKGYVGKVFNRGVGMPFLKYTGEKVNINNQEITVYSRDESGDVLFAVGTVTISDDAEGYAKGALYIDTDVTAGTSGVYENVGTTSACNFDVIGGGGGVTTFVALSDTPANFTSAGDKIVKVNTGATALEFVAVSGDVAMSAAGVFTVTDLTISSEAQGDLLQRGAAAWEKLTGVAGDLIQRGASKFEVITGANDGDVLRYSTGSAAWSTVDPATLPAGIASGLSSTFTMEGGTHDITVTVTAQTVGAPGLTMPDFANVDDTFAFLTLAQTFIGNKTFNQTALWLKGGDANAMNIKLNETLTGAKTLNLIIGDTDRTITLGGNIALGGTLTTLAAWTQTGAHTIGLTTTGATALTLPTSGTLVTLAGSEALSNKTYEGITLTASAGTTVTITAGKTITLQETMTITAAAASQTYTMPTATDTMVGRASTDTLTNKTVDANGTGNVFTNFNIAEMEAKTIPAANGNNVQIMDGLIVVKANNPGATIDVFDGNAPFAFAVIDAWSLNISADGGTWKLNNGTAASPGTDITDVVTAAATDKEIDRITTIDDAAWTVAASGNLSVVASATLDSYIFIRIARLA